MAAVHGDGTLVVVCDSGAWRYASEESELESSAGTSSGSCTSSSSVSSQPVMDVITVIDMLAQYRRLVHII